MEYLVSTQFKETIAILLISVLLFVFLNRLIKKVIVSKTKDGNTIVLNIWRMTTATFVIILTFIILSINGIHIGKYLAGFGIVSAVAGFALQDPIKDIISGISIVLGGYFKLGDVVEYKGELGKVVGFSLKSTCLFMLGDERTLFINNRNITEISRTSDWLDIDIPIGYDIDLHFSRALCKEAARRIEKLRYVYVCDFLNTQELAESWILYRLRIHCMPEKKYFVRRNSYAVVQDVFYENNTEFPLSIKVIYDDLSNNERANRFKDKRIVETAARQKTDYELGKGAVKSKVVLIDGSAKSQIKAVNEAERYAQAENLSKKMKYRLRLLSEETLSLTNILTDITDGEFYISREGTDYEIRFDAVAQVDSMAHKKLVSLSTSGVNEAYEGIGGIIKRAIDSMVIKERNYNETSDSEDMAMERSIIGNDDNLQWSYNNYNENQKMISREMKNDNYSDNPNNLEMSVLTEFADDIKIAVRANHINIRVLVKSDEEII